MCFFFKNMDKRLYNSTVTKLMATVLIKLKASTNQKTLLNTSAAAPPIYKGNTIKRFTSRAVPVPMKQAPAKDSATVLNPFRNWYTMDGSKMKADVIKKLAISPTPPLELSIKLSTSFKPHTIIPSTGPNKKAGSIINTLQKSNFR